MKLSTLSLVALATAVTSISARADTILWTGGDGQYLNGINWSSESVPNTAAGDVAVINDGNVTYTAGPDLAIHNGGALEINGGSWTQVGNISWIQMAGGSLRVNGGSFVQGSGANIVKDASSIISITSGTASFNNNFEMTLGTYTQSGGAVTVGAEFKPLGGNVSMSGGTLDVKLISFDGIDTTFTLAGGAINIRESTFSIYGAGNINFTLGSTASIFITAGTQAQALGYATGGSIRYNGVTDASKFNIVEGGGGVTISAVAVPEPSTFALIGLTGLGMAFARRKFAR